MLSFKRITTSRIALLAFLFGFASNAQADDGFYRIECNGAASLSAVVRGTANSQGYVLFQGRVGTIRGGSVAVDAHLSARFQQTGVFYNDALIMFSDANDPEHRVGAATHEIATSGRQSSLPLEVFSSDFFPGTEGTNIYCQVTLQPLAAAR